MRHLVHSEGLTVWKWTSACGPVMGRKEELWVALPHWSLHWQWALDVLTDMWWMWKTSRARTGFSDSSSSLLWAYKVTIFFLLLLILCSTFPDWWSVQLVWHWHLSQQAALGNQGLFYSQRERETRVPGIWALSFRVNPAIQMSGHTGHLRTKGLGFRARVLLTVVARCELAQSPYSGGENIMEQVPLPSCQSQDSYFSLLIWSWSKSQQTSHHSHAHNLQQSRGFLRNYGGHGAEKAYFICRWLRLHVPLWRSRKSRALTFMGSPAASPGSGRQKSPTSMSSSISAESPWRCRAFEMK